jgi:hypothetical protein
MKRKAPSLAFLLFLALPAAAFDPQPLRLAIHDLAATYPRQYTRAPEFLARLDQVDNEADFTALQREALLANPLLDFDRLLVLERKLGKRARAAMSAELGVGTLNAHSNDSLRRTGWDNGISILSNLRGEPRIESLYKPDGGRILTDIDLHPGAERIMFSSIGGQGNWRLFEMGADGSAPRQITPDDGADVGHFDSCYLPDGRIIFASTAVYQGLPCEAGNRIMVCLYLLDPATGNIRQLTFEQDSDWCPTVLPDGRVMYQRWEYSDLAAFQFAPPVPDESGRHQSERTLRQQLVFPQLVLLRPPDARPSAENHRRRGWPPRRRPLGRLMILDPAISRKEAEGVVHEIPGYGRKVEAIVKDQLVNGVWPQFLMPWPLR